MVPRSSRSSHDWVRSYLDITFRETDAASTHARDAYETQEAENASQAATWLLSYLIGLLAHCLEKNFSTTQHACRVTLYRRTFLWRINCRAISRRLDSVYLGHATVESNRDKENEQDRDN